MATASVSLVLSDAQVKSLLQGQTGPVVADLGRRCIRVETRAKQLLRGAGRIDTGRLVNSVTHRIVASSSGLVGIVGTNLPYGRYVHDGTGIYGPKGTPIRAKSGGVLAWPIRGVSSRRPSMIAGRGAVVSRSQTPTSWAFAREVRGIPPVPFLRDALPAALD